MKLSERQAIFALNVSKLINHIFESGYKCTLGEAWRTHEQAQIYAKEGKGIINSLHCDKLAIDLNLFTNDGIYLKDVKSYEPFGIYWESLDQDNRWGGNFHHANGISFVDSCHFEMEEKNTKKA